MAAGYSISDAFSINKRYYVKSFSIHKTVAHVLKNVALFPSTEPTRCRLEVWLVKSHRQIFSFLLKQRST